LLELINMIKALELLEETSKSEDLLDVSKISTSFNERISSVPNQSLVSLVGPFGVGKSTMLNQIIESDGDSRVWIEFDAWKYPNRANLWEGFVLDVAEQIGDSGAVFKQVQGKSAKGPIVDIATDVVSLISEKLEGINFLDKFTDFFKKSPATRVFELQKILKGLIESQSKDMVIIIEDIDRSGDSGIYFLETLKQFLRSVSLSKKVTVVVPIANHNYHANIDSYLKCIDYFDFFTSDEIKLDNFVTRTFEDALFTGEKRNGQGQIAWTGSSRKVQTVSFLESLFKEMPSMNLRLLKLILRKTDIVYKKILKDGHEPDFRVVLCLEASKYFKINSDDSETTYYEDYKKRGMSDTTSVFSAYLFAMLGNSNSLYEKEYINDKETHVLKRSVSAFNFIERKGDSAQFPSEPWSYKSWNNDSAGYAVAKFYLDY